MNIAQRVLRTAAAAALVAAAACSDSSPVAPRAVSHTVPNASLIFRISKVVADTTVTQFIVDPTSSTWFPVGSAHAIYFPANSICDPKLSTYGPTEWDKPCTPLTKTIVITAKSWTNADGLPQVDFAPALRFTSPSAGDDVQLVLKVTSGAVSSNRMNILYCTTPGALICTDESLLDPSLATQVDKVNSQVYRRVKHFSGYNVSVGRTDVTVDLGL